MTKKNLTLPMRKSVERVHDVGQMGVLLSACRPHPAAGCVVLSEDRDGSGNDSTNASCT